MRLYSGQFNLIAGEIVKSLLAAELLDVLDPSEAELDVVSVLRSYNRATRQVTEHAREIAASEGSGSNEGRIRHRLARERGLKMGVDALEYVVNQIIEVFLQSAHIEEIYGTDRDLRAKITPVIKKYTENRDEELDVAVQGKIRNLKEGSAAWDIEYERVMGRVRQRKGLETD